MSELTIGILVGFAMGCAAMAGFSLVLDRGWAFPIQKIDSIIIRRAKAGLLRRKKFER